MNKWILTVFVLAVHHLWGQQITSYEYWYDDSYANRTTINTAPANVLTINEVVSTTNLVPGIHTFHFRAKANNGFWSGVVSSLFYKLPPTTTAAQNIVAYQYWFDNNFSNAQIVNNPPQSIINLSSQIDVNQLSHGIHTFYIRFKDDKGQWSSIVSSLFYKLPETPTASQNIVAYQYWFDNNFSNAQIVNNPPQSIINLSSQIDVNQLSHGIHTFYFRFKDDKGQWSTIVSSLFYKLPETPTAAQNIVAYQYWFDDDNASQTTVNTTPSAVVLLNVPLSTDNLSNGLHTLNIRFKDNSGKWSLIVSSVFYKTYATTISNSLLGYRYWFDDEQSFQYVSFSSPISTNFILLDQINMTTLEKGQHILFVQFLDSLGQWSVPVFDTVVKISFPVARFTYNTEFYCDSTIVHFIDQSTDGDVYQWFVNGQLFSTSENPSYTFSQPGFYDITLFIQDTISLLDSNITHQIEIKGKTYSTISATACNEYLSPSGNYLWDMSGTYLDTISNSLGCDSIITINLTILQSSTNLITPVVCDSFVSPSGQYVWYASGTYLDILTNSVGCDSNIVVQLTVVEVDTSIQSNQQQLWANTSNASYQWCMCDNSILIPISNANNQSYMPLQSGYYAVVVTQQGCSDTSSCHYFNYTYAGYSYQTDIKVYPNPLKDSKIHIILPEQSDMLTIQLFDVSGKPVLQKSFSHYQKISLELDIPSGIYFMQIQTDKENSIFKIIKS